MDGYNDRDEADDAGSRAGDGVSGEHIRASSASVPDTKNFWSYAPSIYRKLKSAVFYLFVLAVLYVLYRVFGYYSFSAMLTGFGFFYVVWRVVLRGRYVYVDEYDYRSELEGDGNSKGVKGMKITTYAIPADDFDNWRIIGGENHYRSKRGNLRVSALKVDAGKKVIVACPFTEFDVPHQLIDLTVYDRLNRLLSAIIWNSRERFAAFSVGVNNYALKYGLEIADRMVSDMKDIGIGGVHVPHEAIEKPIDFIERKRPDYVPSGGDMHD